jgi:tetratricopeptide (TPR) repeat protein
LQRHLDGCAVMRCLGAKQALVTRLYVMHFTMLGGLSAAAGVAIGATLLQSPSSAATELPEGDPPLLLDLGLRQDPEARDLGRALRLYREGDKEAAGRVFARYRSLDARVGQALAGWPTGTLPRLEELAAEQPRSGIVRLNLGFALFWSGRREDALAAWRQTRLIAPDSLAAVRAGDLLYPQFAAGLPTFTPGRPRGEVGRHLLAGVRLQRLGRQISARREFDAAAALAPDDPQALVAAAMARFDKANPSAAFSRLGPLAARFPRAPTVRFHLGVLLLWLGRVDEAEAQLRRARSIDPRDPLAREADRFLDRLESIESG